MFPIELGNKNLLGHQPKQMLLTVLPLPQQVWAHRCFLSDILKAVTGEIIFFSPLKKKSGGDISNTPGEESASILTPISNQLRPARSWRALQPLRTRSKSDPVLHHWAERGEVIPQASRRAHTCLNVSGKSRWLWSPRFKRYLKGG